MATEQPCAYRFAHIRFATRQPHNDQIAAQLIDPYQFDKAPALLALIGGFRWRRFMKQRATKAALERLILAKAAGEWGCEDMTGVTVEKCNPRIHGRNWTATHFQNLDLPAGEHTVQKLVEQLGLRYDLHSEGHLEKLQ
jgi:hypothetical protein